eukprot:RCo030896
MNLRGPLALLLLAAVLLGLAGQGGLVQAVSIRLATVLTTPLQPFDSSLHPCANITGCFGGFPIISAHLRYSAASHNQITLWWLDASSKVVEFHPKGLALNNVVWQRAGNIGLVGWAFDEAGLLTTSPDSIYPLFTNMIVPPVCSNAHLDQDSAYYAIYRRHLVVPPSPATGNLTLGIVVILDWTKKTFPMFDATAQLPVVLTQLRKLYKTDMNIVLIGSTFMPDWTQLLGMDMDVLVTGTSFNVTLNTPPPTQYFNGTGVAIRSNTLNALSYLDIDLDLWRARQSFLSFSEVDLTKSVNFATLPINDANYTDDLAWMQTQIKLAAANDFTVGTCDAAVPAGDDRAHGSVPCRYQECAIGTWWTQIMLNFSGADVAFINGGSFSAGWPAGAVNLSNIWASYPFTDSVCTFQVYGIDLYDVLVYSVSQGAPTIAYARNTGPFAQLYNIRLEYNPALNATKRITAIEIFDKTTATWGPLKRGKIYTVATTTYICGGGDNYAIHFVPGTAPLRTSTEIHGAALQVVHQRGSLDCPSLLGTLNITSSTTSLIMVHQTQASCVTNTYWEPSELACLSCPVGTSNSGPGLTTCYPIPGPSSVNITVPLIVGLGGGCLLLLLAAFVGMHVRRQRQSRRLLAMAPTGQVTMVFTDVQGSTSLWDQHPEAMSIALDIHNQVIREELPKFGGYEVKTIGDSFMVAFPNPVDAIACCVSIQLLLLAQDWPEAILTTESGTPVEMKDGSFLWRGIRVRMGIQTGQPEVVVDYATNKVDYFGPSINEAARVESKAHGGEICITKDVMDMIERSNASEDWDIKFIGEHSFKGVSQKIPVYSLHHISLAERTYPPEKPLACDKCQEPLKCPRCDASHKTFDTKNAAKRTAASLKKQAAQRMSVMSSFMPKEHSQAGSYSVRSSQRAARSPHNA